MNVRDEAIEAAAQAIGEVAQTRDFRVIAEAAIAASASYLTRREKQDIWIAGWKSGRKYGEWYHAPLNGEPTMANPYEVEQ